MELTPTKEKPSRIEAINKDAVHQICSGQVRISVLYYYLLGALLLITYY